MAVVHVQCNDSIHVHKKAASFRLQSLQGTCIAQIGLHRFPGVFYGAHTLYHHPEMLDVPVDAKPEELLAWSKRLMESDEFIQIRDRFMLVDLEQNLFRSAIRMTDCIVPIHYYVFCNTWSSRTLIDAAKARFEQTDNHAHVEVVDDAGILQALIDAEKPEEKRTIESRIRYQISLLPPGTPFTVRAKPIKGLVAINILERAGVEKSQFDKLKERNEQFKRYMDSMKTDTDGYYLTPMQ